MNQLYAVKHIAPSKRRLIQLLETIINYLVILAIGYVDNSTTQALPSTVKRQTPVQIAYIKAIGRFNDNFQKKFKEETDFITHQQGRGYYLNTADFEIMRT